MCCNHQIIIVGEPETVFEQFLKQLRVGDPKMARRVVRALRKTFNPAKTNGLTDEQGEWLTENLSLKLQGDLLGFEVSPVTREEYRLELIKHYAEEAADEIARVVEDEMQGLDETTYWKD